MSEDRAATLVAALAEALLERGWRCVAAESCTGGGIAKALTERAGSSDWFDRGFVAYSNQAKQDMLGVPAALIERHGAVSEETARAMAEGALRHARAQAAMAVTGVAGPGGGSAGKPVGTVAFGWAVEGLGVDTAATCLAGDRQAVRQAAVEKAIAGLLARLRRA